MKATWIAIGAGAALSAFTLAACSGQRDPEPMPSNPVADRHAIAMAEEMSEPPAMPISPEPITRTEVRQLNLPSGGCRFMLPSSADPVLLAQAKKGWIKLDGKIVELVSDRTSLPLPDGAWSKYIGLANWLTIALDRKGAPGGGEIVIHEARDRVVFRARGTLECAA